MVVAMEKQLVAEMANERALKSEYKSAQKKVVGMVFDKAVRLECV